MRTAHISRRQAEASFDHAATEDEVFAVQREEDMRSERAEIDRLLDEVDRELASEQRTERARFAVDASDGQWVRRARRRSQRAAVRSLRLVSPDEALTLAGLAGADLDGEAA
jgi:hypothetical protein